MGRSFPSVDDTTQLFDGSVLSALDKHNDGRYAALGSGGGGTLRQRFDTAGEALAAKLDIGGGGDIVMSLMSDSTGAPDTGWWRTWAEQIAAARPALRVEYALWDDAAQSYPVPTVLQAGSNYVPPVGVVDSFNRTSTSLNQSKPEVGGVWNGPPGVFSLSGSRAVVGASIGEIVSDAGATGNATARASGVVFNMTPPSSGTKQFKVFAKYLSSSTHVYVLVQLSSTGVLAWQVIKRIAGAASVLFTGENFTYTANADNTLEIALTVSGTAVTASVNEKSGAGSLTQSDVDTLAAATAAGLGTAGGSTLTGLSVDAFSYVIEGAVSSGQKLTVYNGSQGGTTFGYGPTAYHLAVAGRLQKMNPVRPDVVFLNSSHNYLDATPAAYVADINQMVTALRTLYPGVSVAVSSQNPRFSPAVSIRPHLERLVALRILALQSGWGYLPVLETFLTRSDGGKSLVLDDGVHPNVDGRTVWRSVASKYLDAHSLNPT